jgi:hypothetical protein
MVWGLCYVLNFVVVRGIYFIFLFNVNILFDIEIYVRIRYVIFSFFTRWDYV